jgi:hypothetical protein
MKKKKWENASRYGPQDRLTNQTCNLQSNKRTLSMLAAEIAVKFVAHLLRVQIILEF